MSRLEIEIEGGQQAAQCLELLKDIFRQDLLGFYLYGSSVAGGLKKYSDIDLLAVVGRPSNLQEKTRIAHQMLEISGIYRKSRKRSVELTIIVQSAVKPWHYPPAFDFQYGDWLRERFEAGEIEPWDSKVMPDVAILITQALIASKTLYGPEPDQVLDRVPYQDFIVASTEEMDSLLVDLESDTRNVLLTLARIWSTLETDALRSKSSAADWTAGRLPQDYQPVMVRARAVYLGEEDPGWEDIKTMIRPCAQFMVEKINEKAASLKISSQTNRSIHLAE